MTDKLIVELAGRILTDLFGEMKNTATRDSFFDTICNTISTFSGEHGDLKLSDLEKVSLQKMVEDSIAQALIQTSVLEPLKKALNVQEFVFPGATEVKAPSFITTPPDYPNLFQDVQDFHKKFGLDIDWTAGPRDLEPNLELFRQKFMDEELREYLEADSELDTVKLHPLTDKETSDPEMNRLRAKKLDALVDLVYVALGTAYLHGWDFNEAWRRVQAANMAKVRASRQEEGKRDATFDVIKPPGWTAPDHLDLVTPLDLVMPLEIDMPF